MLFSSWVAKSNPNSLSSLHKSKATLLLLALSLTCGCGQVLAQDAINNPQTTPAALPPAANTANLDAAATEINAIISAKQHPYLQLANFTNRAEDVNSLYKTGNYHLLWLGTSNAAGNIQAALKLLSDAATQGLNADSYDSKTLQEKLPAALQLAPTAYKEQALYDTALSIALLRFSHDLHYGRVNPKGIDFNLKLRDKLIDLPSLLQQHLALGTLADLPLALEPKLKQYSKLKLALATYRLLASQEPELHLTTTRAVRHAESLSQSEQLRRFLRMVGDLQSNSDSKAGHYHPDLVASIKKFQQRHGINPDGVLGKATVAALNVPLKQRVAQIELAMERLRWLPPLSSGKSIIVNIPAFQLWAFDDVDQLNVSMPTMRVVVGKALKTQTPVLMAEMRFVDFMPYWNVPYKIVNEEIVPKLAQRPSFLAAENMELISRDGNKPVNFTGNAFAQLKQGSLGIRQKPGKKNALGRVKFIFPNRADVYLHDTPSTPLFSRSRRDFSHGCVRVADPERLAEFVLKNEAGWDMSAIQKAMTATLPTPKTQRVFLKQSIPVLFFYTTAFFDENDKLAFYDDIYAHDNVLLEALKKPEDLADEALFASAPVTNTTASAPVIEEDKPLVEASKPMQVVQ